MQALLENTPLAVVYGIAGIGKTEFVYQLLAQTRSSARWRHAVPLLLPSTPSFPTRLASDSACLLAALRQLLQLTSDPFPGPSSALIHSTQLAELAAALEAKPSLVFIDDLHHFDLSSAALVLSYLSRRITQSRLLIASRKELLLPPGSPPPATVRLHALSQPETAALATQLASTLGLSVPCTEEIFRRSQGSPLQIHLQLSGQLYAPTAADDGFLQTLEKLSPEARQVLLLVRMLDGKLADFDRSHQEGVLVPATVWELAQHFLIDPSHCTVYPLVWESFAPHATTAEFLWAKRAAATLHLRRFCSDPQRFAHDGIDALRHWLAAEDAQTAWDTLQTHLREFIAAQLEHLVLELLPSISRLLPEQHLSAELLRVQLLLRQSRLSDAQKRLAALRLETPEAASYQVMHLAGVIALRTDSLGRAAELFQEATAAATSAAQTCKSTLRLAQLRAMQGDLADTRALLAEVQKHVVELTPTTAAQVTGSSAGILALGYLAQDQTTLAASHAATETARLNSSSPTPFIVSLNMIELWARCLEDEPKAARALLDQLQFHIATASTRHQNFAVLFQGVVQFTEGDLPAAHSSLSSAYSLFASEQDQIYVALTGYYLGAVLLALSDLSAARQYLARTSQLATQLQLFILAEHTDVLRARVALESMRFAEAQQLAEPLAQPPTRSPRARLQACYVLWRLCALQQDWSAGKTQLGNAPSLLAQLGGQASAQEHKLEHTELKWWSGDADDLRSTVAELVHYYENCGRLFQRTRAQLLQVAVLLTTTSAEASNSPAQLLQAELLLEKIESTAARYSYGDLLLRATLLGAAIARQRGDERRAQAQLLRASSASLAEEDHLELQLLRAAAHSTRATPIGLQSLLERLQLCRSHQLELRDRSGPRLINEADLAQLLPRFELYVDLNRSTITAPSCSTAISGRPLMCTLLSRLLVSANKVVDAETLFRDVWCSTEYHALRHRNTVYVAITRLRRLLRELLPTREVLETAESGWRLAQDLKLCVIRALP